MEIIEPRVLLSHTLVIGHQGNSMHAPENTLASLDQAFRRGADVVEVDVQPASDGIIVAMHDTTLDRTTDGTGAVASTTVAQIKNLDAGSWFSDEYAGERVPTLAEFLETADRRGTIYLDLKAYSMGAAIRQLLDDAGWSDESVWTSADEEIVARDVHEHLPNAAILWYGDVPTRGTADYFQAMRNIGVTGFDLKWGEYRRRFVRDAQANGMFFSTYTIDNRSQWRAALKMDLDAIETNDPGGLAAFVAERRGQVTANMDGGTLSLIGDAFDNSVRIEASSPGGLIRVTGVDGTLINGQSGPVEFAGVRDVGISLNGGNDVVEIMEVLLVGGLSIDGGRGNDRASIRGSAVGGRTESIGGAGTDWFKAEHSMFDQVQIDGAGGYDVLDMGLGSQPNARANDLLAAPLLSKVERLAT